MIIQIRGTSGSGKTTVMRRVMDALGPWNREWREGRKKPLLYYKTNGPIILGHYEDSACGGCDTIGSAAKVYDLIQEIELGQLFKPKPPNGLFRPILCEGLLLSEDVKWTTQMNDPRVIFLTTSIEECIERVKKRRAEAGNDKPLNEHNTRNRVAVIERARVRLNEAGIITRRASSDQAAKLILNWLKG